MKVFWSARAKARLREIYDYIAIDSPTNALAVVDRLSKRSLLLAEEPRADRQVPEYMQEDLREVLVRPWRIIYQVNSDRIYIVTVKHYRQRLADKPKDF
jgi:toxin ParE1/3/4